MNRIEKLLDRIPTASPERDRTGGKELKRMKVRGWVVSTAALAVLATGASTAALAPERRLAGITVGSKAVLVLRRYGNPSVVSPGLVDQVGSAAAGGGAGGAANPYAPGPGGTPPGASGYPGASSYRPGGGAPGGGYPGASSYRPGGGYPGASRPGEYGSNPGSLPPAGSEGAAGDGGAATDDTGLVTWTYRQFKNGPQLSFRVDEDGRVAEVVARGFRPTPLARTGRGITLGDSYGKVLRVYGFPEDSVAQGDVMTIKYNRAQIGFRFYRLKVVAIAVAMPKRASNAAL
jgi:hypothetical protein